MRTPWSNKKRRSTKKQTKLAAKERRALQEADEGAGRQSPQSPMTRLALEWIATISQSFARPSLA